MKKILPILILIALISPIVILASVVQPHLPHDLDLLELIGRIAMWLFWILLALAIVMIVYAGLLFVTASGNAEQVEKARGIILYAIIGIVIAMLAYAIRTFLLSMAN